MNRLRKCLGMIAACLLLGPWMAAAADASGSLVSVAWLQQNLGREHIVLLDASPAKAHAAAHIPGAISVDVFAFGAREPSPGEMEERMRSWGVSPGKRVVLYDPGASYLATSLLFDLHYHGVPMDDLAVLDGGLAKWQSVGGAVTKEATPAPKPGTFRVTRRNEDVRVRLPEFLNGTGDPARHAIVEALEPASHFGGARFFDRAGHVPNAIMLPSGDFFNADKTFKSPAEIRRMFDYLGIRPEQALYSHCGGGIAAAVPFFAAKVLLGYPDVKLYKESQLEWLRDDRGLPFWTYDHPNYVRDRAWVNGWNTPLVRSVGVSRMALVDVRPAAEFNQAHVPYAVNVPAEEFRRHLASPGKLAGLLGAAGVDSSHEAVIVSSGGLNPDSALAFLVLERLGQKRVSLLPDSVDDWGFAGFALRKATDTPDPKRPAPKPAAPTTYPVALRAGTIIDRTAAPQGLYPRIYIASGKAMPAKLPEGKVVHVPYTDLVDARGVPKPAMEIWRTLVKAGVPRYAELVAIADDAGEAAAGYFILRLMGWPDVKVLLP